MWYLTTESRLISRVRPPWPEVPFWPWKAHCTWGCGASPEGPKRSVGAAERLDASRPQVPSSTSSGQCPADFSEYAHFKAVANTGKPVSLPRPMRVRYGCLGAAKVRGRRPGGGDPGRRFSGEASLPDGDVTVTLQDAPRLAQQALDPRLHPAVGFPLLADVLLAPEPDCNVAMRTPPLRRRQRCQKLVFVFAPRPPSPSRGTPPPETPQRSASRSISTGSLSPQS